MAETVAKTTHFVFVVETGFTMQALSSAVEVLRVARKLGADHSCQYSISSLDNQPTAASNGIMVVPDLKIDDLPRTCNLVVISGAGADQEENPGLIAKLRLWDRTGHKVWGISSGVVRLAQAGLLDGSTVAAHWEDVPYLKQNHPKVVVASALFITESRHPTCAGGGAAADFMLHFVRRTAPRELIGDIASRLMIDGVRDGRMRQALPSELHFSTSHRTAFAAIRLMQANCYDALRISEIAKGVGKSQRQLERLFHSEFGKPPSAVYLALRLDEARQEVLAGRRPMADIALDYGFQPGNFSKVYRRMFGVLPSDDRKR